MLIWYMSFHPKAPICWPGIGAMGTWAVGSSDATIVSRSKLGIFSETDFADVSDA